MDPQLPTSARNAVTPVFGPLWPLVRVYTFFYRTKMFRIDVKLNFALNLLLLFLT